MKLALVVLLFAVFIALTAARIRHTDENKRTLKMTEMEICEHNQFETLFKTSKANCGVIAKALVEALATNDVEFMTMISESAAKFSSDCSLSTGLACSATLYNCKEQCNAGVTQCISCLGSAWTQCCPCIKKILGVNVPC